MTPVFRAILTLGATALLAACSGGSSVPPAMQQDTPSSAVRVGLASLSPSLSAGLSGGSKSPCNLPSGWDFLGPCKEMILPFKGTTITFPSYRGFNVSVKIGMNGWASNGKPNLVMSEGTGDSDIVGKHYEGIFPVFGSRKATCVADGGGAVPCKGKGFLYILYYAATSGEGGGFPNFPAYHITYTGKLPGTVCSETWLVWKGQWFWGLLNSTVKPKNGSVTFPAYPNWIEDLQPGQLGVVGFYCKP
jgi:hypothetical protein